MAVIQNTYTGDGSTVLFSFTFEYLNDTEVRVSVNGVNTTEFTLANATTVQMNTAPANGALVRIYRVTDIEEPIVTYNAGSAIRARDLNDNESQLLNAVQELEAYAVFADGSKPFIGDLDANGYHIKNLGAPSVDSDAATKGYVDTQDALRVSKAGDTMSGNLAMGGNKVTGLGTPSIESDAATKQYVDNRFGDLDVPGYTRWRITATEGQTVFSGAGEYGGTLAYSTTRENVYINGVLQQRNVDYTADDGDVITFNVGLTEGDVVEVVCVNNLNGGVGDQASDIYFVQDGTGAVTRTVDSKLKDAVSVKDFGAVGDGVADDTAALQAFFDHIAVNDVGTAYCSGKFLVSAPITFGTGVTTATRHIVGQTVIIASTAIDTLFKIDGFALGVWDGFLTVQGTGSTSYASRTCGTGLLIGNSGRATFTAIRALRFKLYGVKVTSVSPGGPTTLVNLGDVDVSDCGTGYPSGSNLTATWSNPVNTGSANSTAQRTTLDVTVLPPYLTENTAVLLGGETYYVYSMDSVNNKITVFPWVDASVASSTLTYIQGAGLFISGSDAGIVNADMVDATRCSVGLWSRALYGVIAKRVVAQFCLAGFAVGDDPAAAAVTFSLNGFYCESNTIDLLRITRADIGGIITAEYAFNYDKVRYTSDPRPSATSAYTNSYNNLKSITIQTARGFKRWKRSYSAEGASTTGLDLATKDSFPDDLTVYSRDSWTINLDADSLYTYTYGDRARTICIIGTGTNKAPTGTITFNAHSGGTVNGGASAAFSGFAGPALFYAYFNPTTNDVTIACPNQIKRGAGTWNPPSIASGASASTTITCTGAVLGDYTQASFSLSLAGLSLSSYVSAADQVTVVLTNNTGGAVDLASGTVRVTAVKSI